MATKSSEDITNVSVQQIDAEVSNALHDTPADPQNRQRLIEEAAYRRAEARGFEPGYELDDWLGAERDIEGASRNPNDGTASPS